MLIETLCRRLIDREGGFVDNMVDRGGPTNMGVTMRALSAYLGRQATIHDIINLTVGKAVKVYLNDYWIAPGFDRLTLPPILIEMIFDAGVHHGPHTAVKILQRGIGVTTDGILGPISRKAAASQAVARAD
jgi:lysozyme family protein